MLIPSVRTFLQCAVSSGKNFLVTEVLNRQQIRTTYILRRKYEPPLHKIGDPRKRLRPKFYIYETLKNTANDKKPDLNLILTEYVEGLGNPGDKVCVRPNYGYNHLLLPGLAVYANEKNIDKYKDVATQDDKVKHSSPYAQLIAQHLSRMSLSVVLSKDNPWTIQPWHIRASFRKCGYTVPEDAITMPEKAIKGPSMDLENKEFYITVTINNLETAKVRCRIHHWSTEVTDRLAYSPQFWTKSPGAIFTEDQEILDSMPKKREIKK